MMICPQCMNEVFPAPAGMTLGAWVTNPLIRDLESLL